MRDKIPFVNICYSFRLWIFVALETVIHRRHVKKMDVYHAVSSDECRLHDKNFCIPHAYKLCGYFVCNSLFLVIFYR